VTVSDRNERFTTSRRARDQSMILLLVGLALLASPMTGIFEIDAKLADVPVTLIYLLVVWAALIVGTALVSRRLGRGEGAADTTQDRSAK
jgi:hypothetical protein